MTPSERFWSKVDTSGECWEWLAGKSAAGYGRFLTAAGVVRVSHRVAWEFERGPIPDGMQLDHRCHNKGCVKLDHLQLVTHQQNQENLIGPYRNSKSGVRGVYPDGKGAYRVLVQVKGRRYTMPRRYKSLAEAELDAIALRNQVMTNNLMDRKAS